MNEYVNAITEEIVYLRDQGGKKYRIVNGVLLATTVSGFAYSFETDIELYLPDASPVRLEVGSEKIQSEVLVSEKFEMILMVPRYLGEKISSAYVSCEPWKLLDALTMRLREQRERNPNGLQRKLIQEGPLLASPFGLENLKKGASVAKERALTEAITMIWGPPGTGKTQALAEIAIKHMVKGHRVAIVSHSNVSVDGAMNRILDLIKKNNKEVLLERGSVLRYGYVRDEKLGKEPYGTTFNYVLTKDLKLSEQRERLEQQKEALKKEGKSSGSLRVANEESLQNIRQRIKEAEKEAVRKVRIVATTISKATIDALFYEEGKFDVVIFDEASMAYVPHICYACGLAKKHFICLGDFKQLAPIAQGESTASVLRQDIYSYLNIATNRGGIQYHPWLVLLDVQRRMHPRIAEFSNQYVYQNLIKHHIKAKETGIEIASKQPFEGRSLAFVDLSGTYNVSSKNSDNSRYNVMSAMIAMHLALRAHRAGHESVSIITPYAAQARLIRAMLHDQGNNLNISCATVHQFQGSESDVVIFDVVESYRQGRVGKLLVDNENNHVVRLINVAITRAKGKFILIANQGFWRNKMSDQENMVMKLFHYMKQQGRVIREKDLKQLLVEDQTNKVGIYKDDSHAEEVLIKDLRKAKHEIILSWPTGRMVREETLEAGVVREILEADKRRVEVKIYVEKMECLPQYLKAYGRISHEVCLPLVLIDRTKMWYGMPHTDASFEANDTVIKTRQWLALRIKGEKTVGIVQSFNRVESSEQADGEEKLIATSNGNLKKYIETTVTCPECKSILTLKKRKRHFIACTKCRYTDYLTVELVNRYLIKNQVTCPVHGVSLIARLSKYGVYVQCKYGTESHIVPLEEI